MKVVKIIKKYRNGSIEHFLLVPDDRSNINIEFDVQEWCESNQSGLIYGYDYDWSIVEDLDLIKKVLKDKMKDLDNQIERAENKRNELIKQLVIK